MAACVVEGSSGLILQSTSLEGCEGYVMMTAQEYAAAQWFPPLSVEDGTEIGVAIFVVWAIAFGFRMLRRQVEQS